MIGEPTYIQAGGPRLTEFLDALPVQSRWLGDHHVVWQTGQQNAPDGSGPSSHTHCSAFVAAVALMLDIYLLRPPDHGQDLLANAQADWLDGALAAGPTASESGWTRLGASGDAGVLDAATRAAASGQLVVAIYKAPAFIGADGTPHEQSGHICIVRPQTDIDGAGGPAVLSVGAVNALTTTMQAAFAEHAGAWPSLIQLHAHATDLQQDEI